MTKTKTKMMAMAIAMALALNANAQIKDYEAKRIEVTAELDAKPAAEIAKIITPYKMSVDSIVAPVVGKSFTKMTAGRPESTLSNWATDALMAVAKRYFKVKADFAVLNIKGLRANMPEGEVTIGDLMQIFPFQNTVAMMELSGSEVLELMQDMANVNGEGVSREVRMRITADGKATDVTIGGKAVNAKRTYRIATIDYLLEGNDKLYTMKKGKKVQRTSVLLRDALIGFIKERGTISSSLDERITKETSADESKKTGKTSLFIVHTNDTHSTIEPIARNNSDTTLADKGGYLRRATLLKELRAKHPDLVLLDAGDFSQGSAYYNLFKGEVEVKLMNAMGYEAATIGNHEFDFGLENMARIFQMAEFPIVCCNYDFTGTPVEGLVKPYTIIERDGIRIGVLGVSPKMEGLVAEETYAGTKFSEPATTAQPVIDYLRETEKCDVIVCLSHLGVDPDPNDDYHFINNTHGIDLVIGGHSHTYMKHPITINNSEGKPVLYNQMGKHARYVGTLELFL